MINIYGLRTLSGNLIDDTDDILHAFSLRIIKSRVLHVTIIFMLQTGTRQQLSNVTSFIDASDLYGSNDVTNANLRTKVDGIYLCFSSPSDLKPHYIFDFFSKITGSI